MRCLEAAPLVHDRTDAATPSPARRALVAAEGSSLVRVCGLTLLERTLRSLARAGISRATVVSSRADVLEQARRRHWSRRSLEVKPVTRQGAPGPAEPTPLSLGELRTVVEEDGSLYVPADVLCDVRLLAALRSAPPGTILVDSCPPADVAPLLEPAPPAGVGWMVGPARVDAARLATMDPGVAVWRALRIATMEAGGGRLDVAAVPGYIASMRRTVRPLWFPAPPAALQPLAERLLLDTAQKGVLDLPARVHGPIETFLVARLCRTGITPNQLTVFAAASAWAATALFATGHVGAGLAVALAVGVLDGLDGKQARVKLETSKVGELEHVSDFLFELSWWSALAWHFHRTGALPWAPLLLLALYVAEGLDGVAKLLAKRWSGKMIDDASPVLRRVRLVGGRRNVYVWIMTAGALAGNTALAYRILPAWEAATAAIHWACLLPWLPLWPGRRAAVARA